MTIIVGATTVLALSCGGGDGLRDATRDDLSEVVLESTEVPGELEPAPPEQSEYDNPNSPLITSFTSQFFGSAEAAGTCVYSSVMLYVGRDRDDGRDAAEMAFNEGQETLAEILVPQEQEHFRLGDEAVLYLYTSEEPRFCGKDIERDENLTTTTSGYATVLFRVVNTIHNVTIHNSRGAASPEQAKILAEKQMARTRTTLSNEAR